MQTPGDLRSFLDVLRDHRELAVVKHKVSPKFELGSVARRAEMEDGPALLFESVEGYDIPVATGLLSNIHRMALGLGVKQEELMSRISLGMDNPVKPRTVKSGPVKEKIVTDNIDLMKLLPIPTLSELDGGPYLSASIAVARDPESSRQNLSYNRMQVKGPKKTGFAIDPWRHLGEFLERSKGVPLECAVCLGVSPAIEMAAAARVPYDEFELAGGFAGEPVELVRCHTIDVDVPAQAEIVIEGRVLPEVEAEGPFGEFTGYYGEGDYNVFEVKAVIHRDKPIFRTIPGGSNEHVILGNVTIREPLLYQFVKHAVPSVKAVHLQPYTAGFHAIVSIDKKTEGEGKNAIFAALNAHVNFKHVIVVDDDINIFDPKEVFWAIATRVQADEDIVVISGASGNPLDRSADEGGVTAKMGIDATVPLAEKKNFTRLKYKDVDKIRLKDYLADT